MASQQIVLDPDHPIIIIDISILFYNAYFEAATKFYLANGDNKLAYADMMKEIRAIHAPDLATFKTLAALIVRRGDTIDYANIHKNEKFTLLFNTVIERLIKKICNTVSSAPYHRGNAILINDCRRANNWRKQIFQNYKETRTSRDIITSAFQFNGKIVEQFWTDVYPKLKITIGLKMLYLPTMEADDLAYFAKLKIQELFNTTTPHHKLIIVTRDHDYLQLADANTKIVNFEGNDLNMSGYETAAANLAIKILTGDTSDNISPIFTGCGEKTAQKLLLELYPPRQANDIDNSAAQFIEAIQTASLSNPPSNIATDIARIQKMDQPAPSGTRSRGRPALPEPSQTITQITDNLLMNIRLIQMSKIPQTYLEEFNRRFTFVSYSAIVTGFNERFPRPSPPPAAPSSAPNPPTQGQSSSAALQVQQRSAAIAQSARSATASAAPPIPPTAAPPIPPTAAPPIPPTAAPKKERKKERKKRTTKKTKPSEE
jgi:5'-3' exonuclease